MQNNEFDWREVNQKIGEILDMESQAGPAMIEQLVLDRYQVSLSIVSFLIVVSTGIEMFYQGKRVCVMEADYRYRNTESFQICKVLGEVVSSCVCDDSGMNIQFESGLALLCRRDEDFENFSLHYGNCLEDGYMIDL